MNYAIIHEKKALTSVTFSSSVRILLMILGDFVLKSLLIITFQVDNKVVKSKNYENVCAKKIL